MIHFSVLLILLVVLWVVQLYFTYELIKDYWMLKVRYTEKIAELGKLSQENYQLRGDLWQQSKRLQEVTELALQRRDHILEMEKDIQRAYQSDSMGLLTHHVDKEDFDS